MHALLEEFDSDGDGQLALPETSTLRDALYRKRAVHTKTARTDTGVRKQRQTNEPHKTGYRRGCVRVAGIGYGRMRT